MMERERMLKLITMIRRMPNGDKCHYDEKYAAARELTVGECLEFMDQYGGPHGESLILRGLDICPAPFGPIGGAAAGSIAAPMAAPMMAEPVSVFAEELNKRLYQHLQLPAHVMEMTEEEKREARAKEIRERNKIMMERLMMSTPLVTPSKGMISPLRPLV